MSAGNGIDALGASLVEALAEAVAARVAARPVDAEAAPPESAAGGRLAVSIPEAAELIGCSADHFRRHVLPDLRIVRSGRLRLVPVGELERWLDRNAARALEAA